MAKKTTENKELDSLFANECRIRDVYAKTLSTIRPAEKVVTTATRFKYSPLIADMLTTDTNNVLRVWEFKIIATYESLGQVLVYLAHKRLDSILDNAAQAKHGSFKNIRAVLAAFEFRPEVEVANAVLNLGIELVVIPKKYAGAGYVPSGTPQATTPRLPTPQQ